MYIVCHQVPLVALQLRLASCVPQVITATREAKLSQVASVQKATTVLRDRALRDHNNMSAQWDIIVRRSAMQYEASSYCQSSLLNIVCDAFLLGCVFYSVMTSALLHAMSHLMFPSVCLTVSCLLPALCLSYSLLLLYHDHARRCMLFPRYKV